MPKVCDLVGFKVGTLTVISLADPGGRNQHRRWLCLCECGKETILRTCELKNKNKRSCGSCKYDFIRTHGMSYTPEYKIWGGMISRCENRNDAKRYSYYGGRGISICERWRNSFEAFIADMGNRPSSRYSIDRIDNDGNYEPSNCRWATASQQIRNQRTRRPVVFRGKKMPAKHFAELIGVHHNNVYGHLDRGKTAGQIYDFYVANGVVDKALKLTM